MYLQINTGTIIVGSSGRGHGETDRQRETQTDRDTDRQTERDTDRQTDRDTHRQTETQTDRQGEREIVSSCRAIQATE